MLSITTIYDHDIYLGGRSSLWWFGTPSIEILPAKKFAKQARNHAYVFAVVRLPEEVWLPVDRDTTEDPPDTQRLPPELAEVHDAFASLNNDILPLSTDYDHAIDLLPGAKVPYGLIYPLS